MLEQEEIHKIKQTDLGWLVSCGLITAVAVFLRFFWLGLKPFHHDEGVNGWFLTNLFRDGVYKYDPANYHGPSLYYITLGFVDVFGLDTNPVRWSVAIWGVAMVVLAFYLRRYIGKIGALATALFLALSPGMVYISRYFIHEIFFVFLALAFVLAVLLFVDNKKAGPGAIAWLSLILFVCLIPPAMRIAPLIADQNTALLWAVRAPFFLLEAVFIYFIVKYLLAWNDGRPIYLLLAAASVAMMLNTKETSFITLGTMGIACVCIWAREHIVKAAAERNFPTYVLGAAVAGSLALVAALRYKFKEEVIVDFGKRAYEISEAVSVELYSTLLYAALLIIPALLVLLLYVNDKSAVKSNSPTITSGFSSAIGVGIDRILALVATAALAVYLIVLFYSSFFTHASGVSDFFKAYLVWAETGGKDHTQNGIFAYIEWGWQSDAPIMILALIGTFVALFKGTQRFAMFVGLWGLGLFLAYTIIPYKTPWLALSFLLPMCISAGYLINELVDSANGALKAFGLFLAAASIVVLAYFTYDLNFVRYDDEDAPMVYAHTSRQFLDMVSDIEKFAEVSGKGKEAKIDVVSPDYWPLVWYMRDYPNAVFHGKFPDKTEAEVLVAKRGEQNNESIRLYSANYKYYKTYKLRSGVDLMLFVRKDIAPADAQDIYKIRETP